MQLNYVCHRPAAQGESVGGAGGRRRPRRNAFLLMGGGVPLDLLNLRLSLIERDFNASDYDMLLALDQVAGGLHRPPPVSDAQLASLPVRVHSSPAKGSGSGGGGGRPILEAAGPVAPARTESRLLGLLPGVLRSKGSKGSPGTTAAAAAAAKAAPVEEDDGPVCSVCLHTFADGTKVRRVFGGGGTNAAVPKRGLEKKLTAVLPSLLLQVMDLPCRHAFCADCIEPWLRLKGEGATCPTCKAAVFAKE